MSRSSAAHPVVVSAGSLLHRVADATELPVNRVHHQAADAIGAGLDVVPEATGARQGRRGTRH
jgi:gamma-glutamyl-gamma-aminobutyrate hydrolase PuuD